MQGDGGGGTWDRKDTCSFPGRLSHWLPLRDRLAKGYTRQRHMGEKFKRDPGRVAGGGGGVGRAPLTRKGFHQEPYLLLYHPRVWS